MVLFGQQWHHIQEPGHMLSPLRSPFSLCQHPSPSHMVIPPATNTTWTVSNCGKKCNPAMKWNFTSMYTKSLGLLGSWQTWLGPSMFRQIGEWLEDSLCQLRIIPLVHAMSSSCHEERLPKGRLKARGSHTTSCCFPFTHSLQTLPGSLLHYCWAPCHCTKP